MTTYTQEQLTEILRKHKLWLDGKECGERANLQHAYLQVADLRGANLQYADLQHAYLQVADLQRANLYGANLQYANLQYANLYGANLRGANLQYADLQGANLQGANLQGAKLLAFGNMRELRTMQFGKWQVGYTHDTLQIGCQCHSIEKWARWDTEAGRKWIAQMDDKALEWADRNLNLVLSIIAANPACGGENVS